jgi:hypothetical protein
MQLQGGTIMAVTDAEELAHLTTAEANAELRYIEALKRSDGSKTRLASEEWKKAADALAQFVLKREQQVKDIE